MPDFDVFFYEAFDAEAAALRDAMPASVRAGYTADTIQSTGPADPPARLISIRTQSLVPGDWLPRLGGILARATGYDHLLRLTDAAPTGPSPALACLPEYCSRAVAEQAALLWMALLRRLPAQSRQWSVFHRDGLTGRECHGATLAVVGVGRIGYEVVRIGRGLGMRVLGVDPVRRHADVDYQPWDEAVRAADVVASCMNLTRENRHFFNRSSLAGLKRGCVFVNVARGELADTAALADLLEDGALGGVGLDVYEDEPRVADALRGLGGGAASLSHLRRLAGADNVLLTPHNAFNTAEAVRRKAELSVRQVAHFLETGAFCWPLADPRCGGPKTV